MKHLFVPYQLALLAKEKGFNEECLGNYFTNIEGRLLEGFPKDGHAIWMESNSEQIKPENCTAPLYQQLLDWFASEHNLYIDATIAIREDDSEMFFVCSITKAVMRTRVEWNMKSLPSTYSNKYEALTSVLTESFKLI